MWIAMGMGLYILVISVSGSAVVFRREVSRWLVPRTVPSAVGIALTADELFVAAQGIYSDYEVVDVIEARRPNGPAYIVLNRDGEETRRLFDPYAVEDIGDVYPRTLQLVEWLVDLHDNLLAGQTGRKINGIAGGLIIVLVLTGAVIWWPGRGRWLHSLIVRPSSTTPRITWQLHSALGFWSLAMLLVWALTAVYFAYPAPFESMIDYLDPDPTDFARPAEAPLLFLIDLHFGRFGGLGVRVLWVILGLLPAAMFVTGFLMWWKRVARRRA